MKLSLGLFRSWKFHRASSLEADNSEERRHFSFKFNSASRSYHVTTIMMRFLYALQGSFILWKQIKKKPKRVRLYILRCCVGVSKKFCPCHTKCTCSVFFAVQKEIHPITLPDRKRKRFSFTLFLAFLPRIFQIFLCCFALCFDRPEEWLTLH